MENNNLTHLNSDSQVVSRIFRIRNQQVMIDRDLAELYHVQTKRINEQVKRNIARFPEIFCFQLNKYEKNELVAICDRFENIKHSSSLPYAFTEQGVAMLSAVLKSAIAIEVSIQIMNAFVSMRHQINQYNGLMQRVENLEMKQSRNENKFDEIFNIIDADKLNMDQGIFFNGQIFDSYIFVSNLIKDAKTSIVLIDNYIDDTVLTLFLKRDSKVKVSIYTKSISKTFALDLEKHNAQYDQVEIKIFTESHDRFLIIDNEVYHIGASLKDLGKRWFAFSKMKKESLKILEKIKELD